MILPIQQKIGGFPKCQSIEKFSHAHKSQVTEKYKPISTGLPGEEDLSLPLEISASERNRDRMYRDRAAESRALHGGFGVGPGQKIPPNSDDSVPLDATAGPEEALSESLSISFGAGSYARRILENMG